MRTNSDGIKSHSSLDRAVKYNCEAAGWGISSIYKLRTCMSNYRATDNSKGQRKLRYWPNINLNTSTVSQ